MMSSKIRTPENLINFDIVTSSYRTPASKLTVRERFFKYIKKTEGDHWEWIGGYSSGGPVFGVLKTTYLALRISYAMHNDDFDPVQHVSRLCDNKKCVNPLHLYSYYNQGEKDFIRFLKDQPFYSSKNGIFLTWHLQRRRENELIKKLNKEGVSYSILGRVFNLEQSMMNKIIHEKY